MRRRPEAFNGLFEKVNDKEFREDHLTLQLLDAIDKQGEVSQRHLAKQMGVALGLTNSYLKRCIKKGFIKISQIPANRYLYYLTPTGFAEKSRLMSRYLSYSFSFYRQASNSCAAAFSICKQNGWKTIILCGASDLAEIAAVRAIEMDIKITGVLDATVHKYEFVKLPVIRQFPDAEEFDAFLITDLVTPAETYEKIVSRVGPEKVFVPDILHVGTISAAGNLK